MCGELPGGPCEEPFWPKMDASFDFPHAWRAHVCVLLVPSDHCTKNGLDLPGLFEPSVDPYGWRAKGLWSLILTLISDNQGESSGAVRHWPDGAEVARRGVINEGDFVPFIQHDVAVNVRTLASEQCSSYQVSAFVALVCLEFDGFELGGAEFDAPQRIAFPLIACEVRTLSIQN